MIFKRWYLERDIMNDMTSFIILVFFLNRWFLRLHWNTWTVFGYYHNISWFPCQQFLQFTRQCCCYFTSGRSHETHEWKPAWQSEEPVEACWRSVGTSSWVFLSLSNVCVQKHLTLLIWPICIVETRLSCFSRNEWSLLLFWVAHLCTSYPGCLILAMNT